MDYVCQVVYDVPKLSMFQKGQIAIFAAVFIVMMGVILLTSFKTPNPASFPLIPGVKEIVPTTRCQIVSDAESAFNDIKREYLKDGGKKAFEDSTTPDTPYKLIRKEVPLEVENMFKYEKDGERHSFKMGSKNLNGVNYDMYFPGSSGEVKLIQKLFSASRGTNKDLLYFIDWGLIFLVPLENGAPKSTTMSGKNYWITDIYQNTGKGIIPDEAFNCTGGSQEPTIQNRTVKIGSSSADAKQLQLQSFTFDATSGGIVSDVLCKPAVYLYPKEKMMVNVKVKPKGFLTYTDPPYDEQSGWNVTAFPDGKLEIQDTRYKIQTYGYLYYEAKIEDGEVKKPEKGYVVSFEQLPNLYYNILPKLGLNAKQTQDFVDYWTKALLYSPFYFVGIMDQENVNNFEPLEITPKPDSINRVRLYFERLDKPIAVKEPDLDTRYKIQDTRYKFSVVDWGGMVKNDPDHPFTCSQ